VYGQVTHLFKTAPDLLGDFKQFLPESAAAAKAQAQARQQAEEAAMISNARGEPMYASPVMSKEVGMGTPSHSRGLPPVGNFAPTPVVKDNKRKRGERQGTAGSAPDGAPGPANGKVPFPGPGGKVSDHIPSSRDGQCSSNHVTCAAAAAAFARLTIAYLPHLLPLPRQTLTTYNSALNRHTRWHRRTTNPQRHPRSSRLSLRPSRLQPRAPQQVRS
jgi:hypothetical protein